MITRQSSPFVGAIGMARRFLLILAVLPGIIRCKSHTLPPYMEPRVTGQVLDAVTGQPIGDVKVFRNPPAKTEPTKPAELLLEPEPGRTDEEGRFELASSRSLTLFGGGWNTLALRLVHRDYANFETNYTLANGTNRPSGEPGVN